MIELGKAGSQIKKIIKVRKGLPGLHRGTRPGASYIR
jgi:hypothetical protein